MSTAFRLLLPRSIYEEMLAQAVAELPNECCGLLAGKGEGATATVQQCFPLVNVLASPTEFQSDDRSMFAAVRAMNRLGLDTLAIYHSHPTSAPIPSRKDLERNYWPNVINFIVSLKDGERTVRGWWLTETEYREADWKLTE